MQKMNVNIFSEESHALKEKKGAIHHKSKHQNKSQAQACNLNYSGG
jgi:hypothetical protein